MEPNKRQLTSRPSFEEIADSKTARSIPRAIAWIFSLFSMFIPPTVRRWILRFFSLLRAKFLISRLGLADLGGSGSAKLFHFESVEREVVTLDGVSLKTTHFFPLHEKEGVHPCIIFRTPYFRYLDYAFAIHFVHRGYHVLIQDVRGRFESQGKYTLNEYEMKDSGCLLKWLSQQPWSDKTVGVIGLSMGGYTSWNAYANFVKDHDTHGVSVKGIVPAISSADVLADGMFFSPSKNNKINKHDPILCLDLSTRYIRLTYELGKPRTILGSYMLWVGFKVVQLHTVFVSRSWGKKIRHLPLQDIDLVVTEDIPDPRKSIDVDPQSEVNQKLNLKWAVEALGLGERGVPTYGCFFSGWYDIFGRATVRDFQAALAFDAKSGQPTQPGRSNVNRLQLIMGDYSHFDDYLVVLLRASLRTFDAAFFEDKFVYPKMKRVVVACICSNGYIRKHRPLFEQLRALIFPSTSEISMSNEKHHSWRQFDNWPPLEGRTQCMNLAPSNLLLPEKVRKSEESVDEVQNLESDSFVWNPFDPTPTVGGVLFGIDAGMRDQTKLLSRSDVLLYSSPPMVTPFEIAGNVKFSCFIRSSATSMDLFAKLCLIIPKSASSKYKVLNLCEGIERYTLKNGESWPKRIEVDLGPICAQFPTGTKVGLILTGGSFPQFSRNLGYGEDINTAVSMTSARHTIFWKHSRLELPVLNHQLNGINLIEEITLEECIREGEHNLLKQVLSVDNSYAIESDADPFAQEAILRSSIST